MQHNPPRAGFRAGTGFHLRALALILLAGMALHAHALETSCHIHPPADKTDSDGTQTTMGPFPDEPACESIRQQLFGAGGRCHCAPGFSFRSLPRHEPAFDAAPAETPLP